MLEKMFGETAATDAVVLHFLQVIVYHFRYIFIETNLVIRDFPERGDDRFVVALDKWRGSFGQSPGSFGGQYNKSETVVFLAETIFYSYTCHGGDPLFCVRRPFLRIRVLSIKPPIYMEE